MHAVSVLEIRGIVGKRDLLVVVAGLMVQGHRPGENQVFVASLWPDSVTVTGRQAPKASLKKIKSQLMIRWGLLDVLHDVRNQGIWRQGSRLKAFKPVAGVGYYCTILAVRST